MYRLLIWLIVSAALVQLGINKKGVSECRSRECLMRIEKATRDVLSIDWQPISVWPKEAMRLRSHDHNNN